MDDKEFIERLSDSVKNVATRADVLAVRQYSLDDMEQRTRQLLHRTAEVFDLPLKRSDKVVQQDRTLFRLSSGARAVVYHASGAMRLVTGIEPMGSLFKNIEEREDLTQLVEDTVGRLKLDEWLNPKEFLKFERLWQIKAAAASPKGELIQPVLCRVVGAYRHFVSELPVWGGASLSVKLAGEGNLDSLTIQMRETTGEVIDQAEIFRPDQAARQVLLQLSGLMGSLQIPVSEVAVPRSFEFGYLSFPKRKAQRLLAPVYVATIETQGEERQGYVFAVPATERAYIPLELNGIEARPTRSRKALRQVG
jgi:hypothetical protein